MKAQSLSVVVPNPHCINQCSFCVSGMHESPYKNLLEAGSPDFNLCMQEYLRRLNFAQQNGCNTVMLTGSSEPQQNKQFLTYFGMFLRMMEIPFSWVEMQTTGVLLNKDYLRFLRSHVNVSLISLSISALNDEKNQAIIHSPMRVCLWDLAHDIKAEGFSLRLSLNLSEEFEQFTPEQLFTACKEMGADQVTLRMLYSDGANTPQAKWVNEHKLVDVHTAELYRYIRTYGKPIGRLPYGAVKYSVMGMSVVLDEDCMGKEEQEADTYKYLILQPNAKLYSSWDDPASLIF